MHKIIPNPETGEPMEVELTADEIAAYQAEGEATMWEQLRRQRDRVLAQTDWTVLADTPTNTAAWKAYRQALRDLPANTADPANPVWPSPPA